MDGSRLLLTIEVKYVDSFSRAKLGAKRYARHLEAVSLDAEATDELVSTGCSQFLRSVLLTDSVRRGGLTGVPGDEARIEHSLAVVLAREDDQTARDVVDRLRAHELPTATSLWTHREFFLAAKQQAELRQWAVQMLDRYVPASR